MTAIPRKYNPGFLSDNELVESFCVRTAEFDSAIETLRECDGSANPHRIVIGPRGSGKTSLLLRIAAEIRRDSGLSRRFFPVVFAEESYEVGSAGEFWLECLSRLADQAPRRGDDPDLKLTVEDLRAIGDDRELGDRCLGALLDFADRERVRLVLIVENLNMMIGDMADEDAEWRLRHALQAEPRIFLLASATSRFDAIDNRDRALYDLFRIVFLRPLDTEECAVLWERVSGRGAPETIQALRILTGGSPRLIAILARFGAGLSFRNLMAELLDLVDDHTEYFKSHLDGLAAQERRVYLALADLWKPATAHEVANRARLETSKCSAHLARLVGRGTVEVTGGVPRRKQYYLVERLYNIYYLMRRSRGPEPLIEALVRFMEAWYSPRELIDIGVGLAREDNLDAGLESLRGPALRRLIESPVLGECRDEMLAAVLEELRTDPALSPVLSGVTGAAALGATLARRATDGEDESLGPSEGLAAARALFDGAVALASENRSDDALAGCDEAIRRFGDAEAPDILALVASALILKGDILAGLHRTEDPEVQVEKAMREAWSGGPPDFSQLISIGLTGSKAASDRAPEALAAYDEVLGRFGESKVPVLSDRVTVAMLGKAFVCLALGRTEGALAILDEGTSRLGKADTPPLPEVTATVLFMRGQILLALDRAEAALTSLEEAVRCFRKGDIAEAVEMAAYARLLQGLALADLGRMKEALVSWDAAAELFARSEIPLFSKMAAVTLVQKAFALAGLDRAEEALGACDEALRMCEENESPVLSAITTLALINRGCMLGRLNRIEEGLAVLDEAIGRLANDDAPVLLGLFANALFNKGELLEQSGRLEEALAVFDEAVDRFESAGTKDVQEPIARALFQKAIILRRLMRSEDALSVFDEAALRSRESDSPELVELAAKALVAKAEMLRGLGQLNKALATNDEVVQRFGGRDVRALHVLVATAHVGRGFSLLGSNQPSEALRAFGDAVRGFGENDAQGSLSVGALAHVGQGVALRTLDRPEEALAAFDEAARLFERDGGPSVQRAGAALLDKAGLELRCRRYAAAIQTVGRALDPSFMLSVENRVRCHLIRARAASADGDASACDQDIEIALALLAGLHSLSRDVLLTLMALSIELETEHIRALIRSSPSALALLPLTTALEQELGLKPKVAREVEEVASDIRERLAKMREGRALAARGAAATDAGPGGEGC